MGEFEEAGKLINWNRSLLRFFGLWPESRSMTVYGVWTLYFVYHLVLNYVRLYLLLGRLLIFFSALIETISYTHAYVRFLLLCWHNRRIGVIIKEMRLGYSRISYASDKEAREFLKYNNIAKSFIRVLIFFPSLTLLLYYLRPLLVRYFIARSSRSTHKNITFPYTLPFTYYRMYQITKVETYALTYASLFPMAIFCIFIQSGTDCLVITLGCHFCGRLAALSQRIRCMDVDGDSHEIKIVIRMYQELLRFCSMIKATFSGFMFFHLCSASIMICIIIFRTLLVEESVSRISIFVLLSLNILRLYIHCWVGEYLVHESDAINAAFYDCNWYNMTLSDRKLMILNLLRSQHPNCFVAEAVGTFSLTTFADVMKTSMAYLSFLRKLL